MVRIAATSRLLVVIGDPVRHSLSPAMHNAAIAALGLDAVYIALPVPVTAISSFIDLARRGALAGNVTVPHKLAVARGVSRRTALAERIGAVNTFWCEDDALVGDNTDVAGVLDALDRLEAPGPWLVAGTGGSARAVAAAAAERGVSLLVRSRQPERARDFVTWATELGVRATPDDERRVGTVINATPLGLAASDPLPIPVDRLRGARCACDLVYARGETKWVVACRAAGLKAVDGRAMLVGQGVHAFQRFFPDHTPPREIMAAAVEAQLR